MLRRAAVAMIVPYRKHVATSMRPSLLVLPQCLQHVPLYVCAALHHPAFRVNVMPRAGASVPLPGSPCGAATRTGLVRGDDRAAHMARIERASCRELMRMLLPSLHPLDPLAEGVGDPRSSDDPHTVMLPPDTWTSSAKLSLDGVALLDDGDSLRLFVPPRVPQRTLRELFAVDSLAGLRVRGTPSSLHSSIPSPPYSCPRALLPFAHMPTCSSGPHWPLPRRPTPLRTSTASFKHCPGITTSPNPLCSSSAAKGMATTVR